MTKKKKEEKHNGWKKKKETKIKLVTVETEERNIRQKFQKGRRKLVKNKKTKKNK